MIIISQKFVSRFVTKSSEITVGTPILVEKDSKTYKYTITNIDASKGTGTVTDQSVSGDKTLTIKVGDYVPKVVITIGYVGYLLVATESIEGLIILGLVVLFLIILYVIAELWKKEHRLFSVELKPVFGEWHIMITGKTRSNTAF